MPNETISRVQAPVKLYDVNRSHSPKEEQVFVRYSSDGHSVTLAHPEIKRQSGKMCDPSISFDNGATSGCLVPYDRATFCAKPIRISSAVCEIVKNCSPYVISRPAVTTYFSYSFVNAYSIACSQGDTTCETKTAYQILYATGSLTSFPDNQMGTVQSYREYHNDGTDVLFSRGCKAIAECTPELVQPTDPNTVAFPYYRPIDDANTGCVGRATINRWNEVKQSIDAYCNYVPPTDPPTTQAPTTEAPTTEATTEPPTNETLNSTSVDILPSTTEVFNNVISVDVLPSSSQQILQTHASLLPSVIPETPAGNGLAWLGLLAIAPVGLGIVAAGVGAYGIYKWCYPDKEEEDIEEAPQSPQEKQESAVAETSFTEPVEKPAEEHIEVKPLPTQGWKISLSGIANWLHRKPVVEPVNQIETQTKETV